MTPVPVENPEILSSIFGYWPSFHDGYLLSVLLEAGEPSLTMTIHCFASSGKVDDKGYYELQNHTLATLEFDGIALEYLSNFAGGNIISALELNDIENDPLGEEAYRYCAIPDVRFHARLGSSYGCVASIGYVSARVISAVPCDSEGNLLQ
jgi:hypothetical protein